MKAQYVTAVVEHLRDGHSIDETLTGLKRTLTEHGHESLYGAILRGVLRILQSSRGEDIPTVTVASREISKELEASINDAVEKLSGSKEYVTTVDETLIGGYTAAHNHQLIDASYKQKLITLYRAITS